MSDGNGDLARIIGALDGRTATLNAQISQARDEIAKVSQKIDDLNGAQKQLAGQITTARQQLAQLSPAGPAKSDDIAKHIKDLESSVAANTAELATQTSLLQQLTAAQKEQAARQQLDREKAQFVVQLAALLNKFTDGAVRYLFATRAIEACAARDITSGSFQGLTDQKTTADFLNSLANVKLQAAAADRIEAEHFGELGDLTRDITAFRQKLVGEQDFDDKSRKDLMSRKAKEEEAVGVLAAPESDAALRSRHARRTWTAVAGALLILGGGVSVLLTGAGGDLGNVPALVAAVLGAVCLIVSWLNSDGHRAQKLANHQTELQAIAAEIGKLDTTVADRSRSAQAQLAAFQDRVDKASVALPPRPAAASTADNLQNFIDAVQQAGNSWRARHAEINLIGKS